MTIQFDEQQNLNIVFYPIIFACGQPPVQASNDPRPPSGGRNIDKSGGDWVQIDTVSIIGA